MLGPEEEGSDDYAMKCERDKENVKEVNNNHAESNGINQKRANIKEGEKCNGYKRSISYKKDMVKSTVVNKLINGRIRKKKRSKSDIDGKFLFWGGNQWIAAANKTEIDINSLSKKQKADTRKIEIVQGTNRRSLENAPAVVNRSKDNTSTDILSDLQAKHDRFHKSRRCVSCTICRAEFDLEENKTSDSHLNAKRGKKVLKIPRSELNCNVVLNSVPTKLMDDDSTTDDSAEVLIERRTHRKVSPTVKMRKLTCGLCNKYFHTQQSLFNHVLIHSVQKTFQCNICEKVFHDSSQLRVHQLVHKKGNFLSQKRSTIYTSSNVKSYPKRIYSSRKMNKGRRFTG